MRPIVRDAAGIGVATGAYGLSFGALAVAAGLSVPQACALSLLMFTGASQFAFVGLIGGGAAAAVATALLLGARNGLYGLRLAPILRPRALAAQFVIDESAAMAVRDSAAGRAARVLVDRRRGLRVLEPGDAAGRARRRGAVGPARARASTPPRPAGFLALLAPQLRGREPRAVAALAAAAALISVPLVPAGVPVLVAAVVAVAAAMGRGGETRAGASGGGVAARGAGGGWRGAARARAATGGAGRRRSRGGQRGARAGGVA